MGQAQSQQCWNPGGGSDPGLSLRGSHLVRDTCSDRIRGEKDRDRRKSSAQGLSGCGMTNPTPTSTYRSPGKSRDLPKVTQQGEGS